MNKIYYTVSIPLTYPLKNILQKDILKYLLGLNRMEIPKENIIKFKLNVLSRLIEYNNIHPRCKPIVFSFVGSGNKLNDTVLNFDGERICDFRLIKNQT
jgi:hypothetical protein